MSWIGAAAGFIMSSIPTVIRILQTVKPASQVEAIMNTLNLDEKYPNSQALAIAKTAINIAKQFGLGGASKTVVEAELKKQYGKGRGGRRRRTSGKMLGSGRKRGSAPRAIRS